MIKCLLSFILGGSIGLVLGAIINIGKESGNYDKK